MKVLIATDKPFAKVAVDGIRKEIEAAGYELALLEKYGDKAKLLEAVKDANAIIIRSDIIDAEVLDAAKDSVCALMNFTEEPEDVCFVITIAAGQERLAQTICQSPY